MGNNPRSPLRPDVFASRLQTPASLSRLTGLLDRVIGIAGFEVRFPVRRPEDLLVFDILFDNLRVQTGGPDGPMLVRKEANRTGHLIIEFPPQSFGEEAFLDATGPEVPNDNPPAFPETQPAGKKNKATVAAQPVPAPPGTRVRMAGRSRLVFTMPGEVARTPFTLESVLQAMKTWPQRRDMLAAPEPTLRRQDFEVFSSRDWLREITAGPSWKEARTLIGQQAEAGSAGVNSALTQAAQRVATQAARSMQTGADPDAALAAVERLTTAELNALPQLANNAERRDAAAGSLLLQVVENLAVAQVDEGVLASIFPLLPFLMVPHRPSPVVTALELPYRLLISPIEDARWTHRTSPLTSPQTGRTELWHTRLTRGESDLGPDNPTKFRAIWSDDYALTDATKFVDPPAPFRMSLDALDRQMLVRLMAGYDETNAANRAAYTPRPTRARRLALSALGALLDSEGNWNTRPPAVGLQQWRHLANIGRDHYVRVMYAGFLMPFGHAASLIKVTERKFESWPEGNDKQRIAVLRQRFFIVVREPVRNFPSAGTQAGWFDFPFTRVEILTRETPNLFDPGAPVCNLKAVPGNTIYGGGVPGRAAFWPLLAPDNPFRFEIAATDLCGKRTTFSMPLAFIGDEANQLVPGPVVIAYNAEDRPNRRTAPVSGISICYAPPDPAKPGGDTKVPTSSVTFNAAPATTSATSPRFTPHLEQASVGIPQVQRLLGSNATVPVTWAKVYRDAGFGGDNKGELFLKLLTPHSLSFGGSPNAPKTDALGGLASPSMDIRGLSRIMGPVAATPDASAPSDLDAALKKISGNQFDPMSFFKGAKILGGVDLATLVEGAAALTGADVPKMLSRDFPDRVEATFDWQTQIKKSDPAKLFVHSADGKATILSMHGKVVAPIANPAGSTFEANASLTNFKVNLFGFIVIWFDSLVFQAARGKKPDVAVELHPGDDSITFGGPLEFVNELRKFIPSNGFSDPPSLSVTPSGISAGYSLNLPSIQVGLFALSNASLGASFALPFDSRPAEVRFNFSERQRPFSLTVSLFGGGGFFAIGIGTEGVREIEAALEFGAAIAIDLGVASGGVEVKGGVYFHWLQSGSNRTVELAGYVRLHGELSVLGLISASLTFNLQLAYTKEGSKSTVWGEATLVIEIEILFFSMSVSVGCRKEFAGSSADPTFLDFIPEQPVWQQYCEAFAAE